ncbi:hypothetical protein [Amycolatopsis sp.]|uniref:hypothetical protein n=1 Tax=Amycolatopsis sp. TaxID=37632 RepID=UPI002D8048EF|nr:hypothetical protein [Amycolatopsis sp.]HET6710911.1 hypothetical protein [Amycolatopsis sp.]
MSGSTVRRALLYSASGGVLTVLCGALGVADAEAAPNKTPPADAGAGKAVQGRDGGPTPERARLQARDVRAAREGEKKPGKGREKQDDFLAKVQGLIKEGARAKAKDPIERMSSPRLLADDLRERKQQAEKTARRAASQAPARGAADPKRATEQPQVRQREAERRRAVSAANAKRLAEIQRESKNKARKKKEKLRQEYEVRRAAEERYKNDPSRFRLPKSVGVCGSVSGILGKSGKGGGCLVADGRGVGVTTTGGVGAGVGAGGSASLQLQVSSANIEDLGGTAVNLGGSLAAGGGVEGSAGISTDGKNNWTASAGPAVGARGSAGVELQYVQSRRLFDWQDVPEWFLRAKQETSPVRPGHGNR